FIERFKAKASKAAQAQSIVKRLERLDRIEDVKLERPDIRINFTVDKVPGKVLVELKHITKSFGEIKIVENTGAEINRGDKIALIGANGKGKSTLLRIIAGTEKFEGERKWGHNVDEAFYAQHQLEALDLGNTVLDELKLAGSQKTDLELRTLLGCFLFSGDDVEKKVRVLSGGEKARVALAKTIVSKANFLLLDEPTNHLDIHSVELLIESMNKYQGSFILVSHDRYFISKVANKIWEIEDQKIKEFQGGYEEYVEWKKRMADKKTVVETPIIIPEVKVAKQQPTSEQNAAKKELQKLQKQFQQVEEKLAKANDVKSKLAAALSDPGTYSDKNKFLQAETEYKKAEIEVSKLNTQYEELFEKIMNESA
ncbi:MAG TPA: ATP-binding cassette domain-containing protein, partial [Chitinophagaceae bacterium]|nr:ATP-binding cassette domain-containing protein [Chitinophagaceae bacterium]